MSNWIVAANPKRYDVMGAFKELKKVDWTQSATNIFVGDIVYIYVSAPEQAIRFKCKVNKVNLEQTEIEDSKYDFTGEFAKSNSKRMELEVLEEYETDALSKDALSCVGFYPPQGPGHLKDEICEFIDMIEQIQRSDRDTALMLIGESKWKKHFQNRVDTNMALRDKFVNDYPIERIPELALEEFCVGFKSSKKNVNYYTFCYRIEFELSELGSMKGSNSQKFGVFYSPKNDSYEYVSRFGNDADTAFTAVKREICALLEAGKAVDIEAIEKCDLANIFKLKLLSTYYPDCYPSIFEESIYDHFLDYLKVDMNSPRYSNFLGNDLSSAPGIVRKGQLLKHWKDNHPITCDWSNQLFTDIMGIVVAGWRNTPNNLVDPVTPGGYVPAGNKTLGVSAHNRQHWVFAPGENAYKWKSFYENGIMALGWNTLGNLMNYESKSDIIMALKEQVDSSRSFKNVGHALWQFVHQMKVGDVIYVKRGRSELVGRGIITSEYEFDEHAADEYAHVRKVNWTNIGQWAYPGMAPTKAFTDLTSYTDLVRRLKDIFEDSDDVEIGDEAEEVNCDPYSKEAFLSEVYMAENEYDKLVRVLKRKKNIILQGPPGVGKTFVARRLAYSIMGVQDESRVGFVQFHQSYAYEDFIQGYRPVNNGFELKNGAFYEFCKTADEDLENDYYFIIDEINRGNLSKIFGELFMLIEADKRGYNLNLLYSDDRFNVPENVHIIGMMNTADRGLAMMDYALRRRFAFYEMKPGFETQGFADYQAEKANVKFDKLIKAVKELNKKIAADDALGSGFCIGHSYFVTDDDIDDEWLNSVVEYELIPLIHEYWFDKPSEVKTQSERLQNAIGEEN